MILCMKRMKGLECWAQVTFVEVVVQEVVQKAIVMAVSLLDIRN